MGISRDLGFLVREKTFQPPLNKYHMSWPGLFCFRPINAGAFQHVVAWLPVPSELMANLGSNSCHSNDVHQKFPDTASQRRVYGV